MHELTDILADVRSDGYLYSLKSFIVPNDPTVKRIAAILRKAEDPVRAAWLWVDRITDYEEEEFEFWAMPAETMALGRGDCDDTSILLVSVLRNYVSPDDVFVVVGTYLIGNKEKGHAWVKVNGEILESTQAPNGVVKSRYMPYVMFNDQRVFSLAEWPGYIPVAGRKAFIAV